MITPKHWLNLDADDDVTAFVERSSVPDDAVQEGAYTIVQDVRSGGDAALRAASERFGGALTDRSLTINADVLARAWRDAPSGLRDAIEAAAANIRACHQPQRPADTVVTPVPGVDVARTWSPLRRVGVYVPGGQAAYPSSLMMGVIPAQIAGVPGIVVTSPADSHGVVSSATLATAGYLGVTEFVVAGGAQAIAALAYGTESVRRVDKIVGPGNAWVTAAKLVVFGACGVDLPAGPSEAVVLTDTTADPRIVAADLLCQAEHGPDSPVVLVCESQETAESILDAATTLLTRLTRSDTIISSIENYGAVVIGRRLEDRITFVNDYAPEHTSIHTADEGAVADRVTQAGSVFVGAWSPESAGDYATGANHVLPTGGLARSYGPLSVEDFGSFRQVQTLTREGLRTLSPTITALAGAEGLDAHALAVTIRFEEPGRFEEPDRVEEPGRLEEPT
jgi:histidinol dehydrogenase